MKTKNVNKNIWFENVIIQQDKLMNHFVGLPGHEKKINKMEKKIALIPVILKKKKSPPPIANNHYTD